MRRFQPAGVVWLVAASLSSVATVVIRDDSAWYSITLVASAVAALAGILFFWRPSNATLPL